MENMETLKVVGEQSQEELQDELKKKEAGRIACLQELGSVIAPILQKHNMVLDIVVTFDSTGMKTALNVLPKQGQ